jgi:hypothetical protein
VNHIANNYFRLQIWCAPYRAARVDNNAMPVYLPDWMIAALLPMAVVTWLGALPGIIWGNLMSIAQVGGALMRQAVIVVLALAVAVVIKVIWQHIRLYRRVHSATDDGIDTGSNSDHKE